VNPARISPAQRRVLECVAPHPRGATVLGVRPRTLRLLVERGLLRVVKNDLGETSFCATDAGRAALEGELCAHCGRERATCRGAYEGMRRAKLACDTCCGHGCEDGRCEPLHPERERASAPVFTGGPFAPFSHPTRSRN
jgi:hypothetical protein